MTENIEETAKIFQSHPENLWNAVKNSVSTVIEKVRIKHGMRK
jgi:hypothetical protein